MWKSREVYAQRSGDPGGEDLVLWEPTGEETFPAQVSSMGKEVHMEVPSTCPGRCAAFQQVNRLFRSVSEQERHRDQEEERGWIRQELPGVSLFWGEWNGVADWNWRWRKGIWTGLERSSVAS